MNSWQEVFSEFAKLKARVDALESRFRELEDKPAMLTTYSPMVELPVEEVKRRGRPPKPRVEGADV